MVRNATRSSGSGSTGIGSRAARQARDTVSTLISRNSCITIEPTAIPARSSTYPSVASACRLDCQSHVCRCGYCDWKISQYMNLMSSPTRLSVMILVASHSRLLLWMVRYCTR